MGAGTGEFNGVGSTAGAGKRSERAGAEFPATDQPRLLETISYTSLDIPDVDRMRCNSACISS